MPLQMTLSDETLTYTKTVVNQYENMSFWYVTRAPRLDHLRTPLVCGCEDETRTRFTIRRKSRTTSRFNFTCGPSLAFFFACCSV